MTYVKQVIKAEERCKVTENDEADYVEVQKFLD